MSVQTLASEIPVYTLKVYAYDYLISYSAPYPINGREFRISFREGAEWPVYRPAEFRTTDPLIQQAIEAHPSFGTHVRILQVLTCVPHLINPLPPDFPRPAEPAEPEPSSSKPAPGHVPSPSRPLPGHVSPHPKLPPEHVPSPSKLPPEHVSSRPVVPAAVRMSVLHCFPKALVAGDRQPYGKPP
jgi:hypothetical protein